MRESAVRRCLAAGASRHDAEDCAQEALLALLGKPELARATTATAWASTVAYRRYVDLLRRRGREQTAAARLGDEADRTMPELAEAVTDRELASWLVDELRRLPTTTQEVVAATGRGVDTDTVARRLGLTRRSVESHLTRARRWLRSASAAVLVPPWLVALRRLVGSATPATATVAVVTAAVVLALPHVERVEAEPSRPSRLPTRGSTFAPSSDQTRTPGTPPAASVQPQAPGIVPTPTSTASPRPSELPSRPPLLDGVPRPTDNGRPPLSRLPKLRDPDRALPDPRSLLPDLKPLPKPPIVVPSVVPIPPRPDVSRSIGPIIPVRPG
ncbi:RNA polymerase sigma factor [Micromonospora sp. NPDC050187]|uniref:RNA polymerase sigma factor n=1 Tax=Micromonospora sp. NPDC050187 TaxID=3364277 RepID=UPI0037A00291